MQAFSCYIVIVALIFIGPYSALAELSSTSPSLAMTYKNYHWRQLRLEQDSSRYRNEWVQAIEANFDSGYINDLAGIEITAGSATPFDKENIRQPTNLHQDQDGDIPSIHGIQQAFIKGRYQLGLWTLEGKYGIRKRRYQLYSNSSSRILDASSQGIDLAANYKNIQIYGAYITGASNYNDGAFTNKLTNSSRVDPQQIDAISILGLQYRWNLSNFKLETLYTADAMAKYFASVHHQWPLNKTTAITLDGRMAYARSIGNKLGYDADSDGDGRADYFQTMDDYQSHYYNLNATLQGEHGYIGIGYGQTLLDNWISSVVTSGNSGRFNSSLSLWGKYSLKGEQGVVLRFGHNFEPLGLPELKLSGYTAYGWGAHDYQSNFRRQEWRLQLSYAFSGLLEGLTVRGQMTNYRQSSQHRDFATSTTKLNHKIYRFYLTYTRSLL